MSYFSLLPSQQTITIKNKKRISLIVPYKSNQLVVFYQDCSYEHREVRTNKVLHEGKLECVVTELVRSDGCRREVQGDDERGKCEEVVEYLCLVGRRDDTVWFGLLNISSKLYQPYQAVFHQTKTQSEAPFYHLIANTSSHYPILIEITPNVQNGVMIKCFQFRSNRWLNDILYCGSRFLSYCFTTVLEGLLVRSNCSSFCLIANGQKSQSVHLACISITQSTQKIEDLMISHDDSFISEAQQGSTLSTVTQKQSSMQFVFTKEVKYFQNFTILGGHITQNGYLFLVGNSFAFKTKQKKERQNQATSMYLNFSNLVTNLDPAHKFFDIKNFKIGRQTVIRGYLGYFEGSMLFIVENSIKRTIHKLCPQNFLQKQGHYDEELYTFTTTKVIHPEISLDFNALLYHELICEQFFEKIKDSPSVIKLNFLMKVNKKMYYKELLSKFSPELKHDEIFKNQVLSCL